MRNGLLINLLSSASAFLVNIAIAFFLTPYIVNKLGVEAYGFINLGTNFINYVSLIVLALNSMAGRFIAMEIHNKDIEKANKYFTSVFYANIFITIILIIPTTIFVFFIERIIEIPANLIVDVKILFALLFLNFFLSIIFSVFTIATFVTDKLYLNSLRNIESNILKATLLVILFAFFEPTIVYMGIVALVVLLYITLFNVYYLKKLTPYLNIKKLYFEFKLLIEIISSGIWNSVTRVGQIMLDGMNLLLANILIGATAMGTLSVVSTIPTVVAMLIGTIAGVFMPRFTEAYAKNQKEALLENINLSIKILGLVTNIPILFIFIFGQEFFSLWLPNENSKELYLLSMISLSIWVISGSINSLYNIFTVTNRLRANAIVLLLTGIINIPIVLIIFYNTNLGVYSFLIVNAILGILRNVLFTIPFSAYCLKVKWNTFYIGMLKSICAFVLIYVCGAFLKYFIVVDTWGTLILVCLFITILGILINSVLVFSKEERVYMKKKFLKVK